MNIYKTAISALVLAPIIGGISVGMLKQYNSMKEKAEGLAAYSQESMAELEAMMNGEEWQESDIDWLSDTTVANEVIRFHVRANSDSEEDQALKLLVRDAILEEMSQKLNGADSREEARSILESSLSDIEKTGKQVIREAGYDYEIHAYLTKEEFPIKEYGDLRFPAGEYEALRVDIGKKDGANWWCVMYPGLCFIDATGGVVAEDGKEELRRLLTEEEYEELLIHPEEDTQIQYRSLLWDWFCQ